MSEGPSRRSFLKGAATVATGPRVPVLPTLGTKAEAVSAAAKSIAEVAPAVVSRSADILKIFRLCEFLMTDLNYELPSINSIAEDYCATFGLEEVYIDEDVRFKTIAIAEFLNNLRDIFPDRISRDLIETLERDDLDGFGDKSFREKLEELATSLKDVVDMLGIAPENIDQLFNVGTKFVSDNAHKLTASDLAALGDDTIHSLVAMCPDLDLPNVRSAQAILRKELLEKEKRRKELQSFTVNSYRQSKELHKQLFKGFKIKVLYTHDTAVIHSMTEKSFDPKKNIYEFLFDREFSLGQESFKTGRAQLQKSIYTLFQRKLSAEDFSKFCSDPNQVRIVPIMGKQSAHQRHEIHSGFYVQFTDPNHSDTFEDALSL